MFVLSVVDSADVLTNSILAKGLATTTDSSAIAKVVDVANNVVKTMVTTVFMRFRHCHYSTCLEVPIVIDIAELDFHDLSLLAWCAYHFIFVLKWSVRYHT